MHPALVDMLRGGEEIEYSAHVVSNGDIRGIPGQLHGAGVLIAGEAAHLLINAGKTIQGMDFAMRSGILAAETVIAASERQDFSATSLHAYRQKLQVSFIMKYIRGFQANNLMLHVTLMSTR